MLLKIYTTTCYEFKWCFSFFLTVIRTNGMARIILDIFSTMLLMLLKNDKWKYVIEKKTNSFLRTLRL